jgi:hypothetical protein
LKSTLNIKIEAIWLPTMPADTNYDLDNELAPYMYARVRARSTQITKYGLSCIIDTVREFDGFFGYASSIVFICPEQRCSPTTSRRSHAWWRNHYQPNHLAHVPLILGDGELDRAVLFVTAYVIETEEEEISLGATLLRKNRLDPVEERRVARLTTLSLEAEIPNHVRMALTVGTLNPCLQSSIHQIISQRCELKRVVERIVTLKLFLAGRTAPRDLFSGQVAIVNIKWNHKLRRNLHRTLFSGKPNSNVARGLTTPRALAGGLHGQLSMTNIARIKGLLRRKSPISRQ